MLKYEWFDLLWVTGMVLANKIFYNLNSSPGHYIILNFIALSTMFAVGNTSYHLHKERQK